MAISKLSAASQRLPRVRQFTIRITGLRIGLLPVNQLLSRIESRNMRQEGRHSLVYSVFNTFFLTPAGIEKGDVLIKYGRIVAMARELESKLTSAGIFRYIARLPDAR